jgi:uncharacterized repeat protein (TIGR03803 family)
MALLFAVMLLISLLCAGPAWAQEPATVLHRFTGYSYGTGPRGGLAPAPDGNYYGTRAQGGAFNRGLVFRMTPDGVVTTIYDFRGGDQGYGPNSTLTIGPDGALVGLVTVGPEFSHNSGVFRVARDGSSYEVLHTFDPVTEGYNYDSGSRMLLGRDGNFYGTLSSDETRHTGSVYRMTPAGAVTILHAFTGSPDGAGPRALVQGPDGGFFGVTGGGGSCSGRAGEYCGPGYGGAGTLFYMTPAGAVTILHSFFQPFMGDPIQDAAPSSLVAGANGSVYGTTIASVFEWTSAGEYRVLTTVDGRPTSLMQTADGTLYGTTTYSAACLPFQCGDIFKIDSDGGRPVYLHSFLTPADGVLPHELIEGSDGALYGTTQLGGTSADSLWTGFGTIFRLDRDGTFAVIHRLMGNPEGAFGDAPLVQATDGNFYSTTRYGGIHNRGTVYRMAPDGGVQVLYTFTGGLDGAWPTGLVQASDGFLYGAAAGKGATNEGTLFRISLRGEFSVIHTLAAPGPSGETRLTLGANGLLYGMTQVGGSSGKGTVFYATLNGAVTVIHHFAEWPTRAPLLQARDGYLYGTASSGVFRIGPGGGFTELQHVGDSLGELIQARDGSIYGIAKCRGQVFRIAPEGSLHIVTDKVGSYCSDWGEPTAGIATDRRGNVFVYGGGAVLNLFRDVFPQAAPYSGRIVAVGVDGTLRLVHQATLPGDTPTSLMQGSGGMLYVTTGEFSTRGGAILRLNAPTFAPSILFTAPAPAGGVTLTWSTVPDGTHYTIMRRGDAGGPTVVARDILGMSFTDTTVVPGVRYSYVVVAENGNASAATSVPWLSPSSRTPTVTTVGDYDGDGQADLTVYRQSTGEWFSRQSGDGALLRRPWGAPLLQDRPVPADYDGDGMRDLAIYRQTTAEWLVRRSSDGALMELAWGAPTLDDLPVPADYDGDHRADIAVYRATTGEWLIHRSTDAVNIHVSWGSPAHGDVPVPADYDGDGQADLAVYRTTTGEWLIHRSTDGALAHMPWGSPALGDVPVPADYDGDGRTDLAVFRASTGEWLIRRSTDGVLVQFGWGAPLLGDVPVVGDYDGDGRADVAVYRELTAEWFVRASGGGIAHSHWGAPSLGDAVRPF